MTGVFGPLTCNSEPSNLPNMLPRYLTTRHSALGSETLALLLPVVLLLVALIAFRDHM